MNNQCGKCSGYDFYKNGRCRTCDRTARATLAKKPCEKCGGERSNCGRCKVCYQSNREKRCSHLRAWLAKYLSMCKADDTKRGRVCDLEIEDLLALWESQEGKCALTGLEMVCGYNDLRAISIDRIHSGPRAHTKDNIQLVCCFINLAKKHHSNEDIKTVLGMYRDLVLKEARI